MRIGALTAQGEIHGQRAKLLFSRKVSENVRNNTSHTVRSISGVLRPWWISTATGGLAIYN